MHAERIRYDSFSLRPLHPETPEISSRQGPLRAGQQAMLTAVALLAALAIICDTVAALFGLPFPGALLAILILGIRFRGQGGPDPQLSDLFDATIRFWPLVFVPAGVGVIDLGNMLQESWLPILVSVIGGTLLTILVTGMLAQRLLSRCPQCPPDSTEMDTVEGRRI